MHGCTLNRLCHSTIDVQLMRWTLVLIFALFGYTKWFPYEAQSLIPLMSNSPLFSWLYPAFGVQGASYALGVAEWAIGLGLVVGAWIPRVSVIAAAASVVTFLTTLTLIMSTPGGWEASAGGFPAMGDATSFLIKDAVLLAASFSVFKHGLIAVRSAPIKQ
ncbi:MAG: YkgB family protein [Pseudomonas sp.]